MEGKKAIKQIIESIRFDSRIDEGLVKDVIGERRYRAPFLLMVQIFNSTIAFKEVDKNRRSCLWFALLEQMGLVVAELTSFSQPRKLVALFQKQKFYDYCNQKRGEYTCLTNKIYGLFPQIKTSGHIPKFMQFQRSKCSDLQYIGNPNWLLTRKIINKWLQANENHLSKDITFITSLLIADKRLINYVEQDSKDDLQKHWNKLWVYLYLWLNQNYLNEHIDQNRESQTSWYNGPEYQILNLIRQLKQSIKQKQDIVIYNLVLFLLEEYLLGQTDSTKFMDAINTFRSIESKQDMTCDRLMMIYLIKKVACRLNHQKISKEFNNIIENLLDTIVQSKQQEKTSFILLHIIPQSKLKTFIEAKKLPFWQYELDQQVNESISKSYLETFHTFDEDQKLNILLNLNNKYFIEHIFRRILEIPEKKNTRDILRVLDKQSDRICKKIGGAIKGDNLSTNLNAFVTQWTNYYRIQLEGVTQQNIQKAIQFLTYDMQKVSKQFKNNSYFPQEINESMIKIIKKLLSSHFSNTISKKYIYTILQNSIFASHLENLNQNQHNELWSQIAGLFLQNDDIFNDLISIEPQEQNSSEKFEGERSESRGY